MKKLLWFWTFMFIALVAMMAYRGLKGVKNEEQVRGEETEFCDKMPEKDRKAADNALADEEAMQNSTHLRFKGVPIDGKLDDFVRRMKAGKFRVAFVRNGVACLTGDFADFKRCVLRVETLSNKDLVSTISVGFPARDKWSELSADYYHLKELLTEKYGKPASCVERFKSSYVGPPRSDFDKFYAVGDGCTYKMVFKQSNGEIVLQILKVDIECKVVLTYRDKENCALVKEFAKSEL